MDGLLTDMGYHLLLLSPPIASSTLSSYFLAATTEALNFPKDTLHEPGPSSGQRNGTAEKRSGVLGAQAFRSASFPEPEHTRPCRVMQFYP